MASFLGGAMRALSRSPKTAKLALPCQRMRLFMVKERIMTGLPNRM